MLRRLLWLALLALALLLLLGLMVSQADRMPPPLSAVAPQAAALPAPGHLEGASRPLPLLIFLGMLFPLFFFTVQALPEAPEAKQPYYRQRFCAFHYSDRAG